MQRSDFRGSTVFIILIYNAEHKYICLLDFKIDSGFKKIGEVNKFMCPKINYKKPWKIIACTRRTMDSSTISIAKKSHEI